MAKPLFPRLYKNSRSGIQTPTAAWFLSWFVFSAMALELQVFSSGLNMGILLLLGLSGILVLHMVLVGTTFPSLKLMDYLYIAYALLTLGSAIWSVAPTRSIIGALPQFALIFLTLWLYRIPEGVAVRVILIFSLIAGVLSLILIPISPNLAFQPSSSTGAAELRGVFKHQLRLGAFMMVATGIFTLVYLNNQVRSYLFTKPSHNILAFIIIVVVLVLSRTRLYTASGIIALGLTIFLSKKGGRKYLTVVLLTFLAIALAMTFNQILAFLELRGFDTGLTGRTLTWQRTLAIMEYGPQNLGFGFRTFETSNFDYIFTGNYRPDHAHNSFLQAYFETGRVGQLITIGLATIHFFTSWKSSIENDQYSYSLFLVIFVIIGSLFGLNYAGALSTIFCFMLLILAIETRKPKQSHWKHEKE